MQPTTERQARGHVEPPTIDAAVWRPFWVVSTRLERLLRTEAIEPRHYAAALLFRRAHERGMPRPRSTLGAIGRARGGNGGAMPSEAAVEALGLLREAHEALGALMLWLLWRCAVEDASWTHTGRLLRIERETARDWTVTAIKAFTLWLERVRVG